MPTDLATDWPFVETDMSAWREWARAAANYRPKTDHQEQTMPHHNHDDIYAQQLIEVLSDAVDILNEAKADGTILQFQISQTAPDGKYALTSLTATRPIVVPPPANANTAVQ